MVDYFALLGEPRRPSLDPERIKETFHRLSRERHPDQAGGGQDAFADLNLAQETLRDPKLRLRHLLALEYPEVATAGPAIVPASLADDFGPVLGLLQKADAFLPRKTAAAGALAKALLLKDEAELREELRVVSARLEGKMAIATEDLHSLSDRWEAGRDANVLLDLYHRFAYLGRWLEQLRERGFQLEMAA